MKTALLLVIFFSGGAYLFERFILAPKRRREAEYAPRITLAEAQGFWDAIEKDVLPIATAKVHNRSPTLPQESRIGGAPIAIGEDSTWPRSAQDGTPMLLLAQINFSEVPALEDFPDHGILQVFSSFDTIDDTGACERVIRWDPDPQAERLLTIPDDVWKTGRRNSDFSERARREGLPLTFEAGIAKGNPFNWPHEENDLCYDNRLPENESVATIMANWESRREKIVEGYGTHWIGGHPSFVQDDIRGTYPELDHLDRVVFHMGFDKDINVGDSGEVNLLISRDALLKRDFDRAHLTWDCS